MQLAAPTTSVSKVNLWIGRVLSGLAILFLLFDGVIKLIKITPVTEAFAHLGYPDNLALTIGALQLTCLAVYIIPRTSVLGAILLTGYLGGATASHVRVGDPLFPIFFPALIGLMIWGGLFFTDERLRDLLPLRK